MDTKPNPPALITYEDCVRQNKRLLREEKTAAKELKRKPQEINVRQVIADRGYAARFGHNLRPLPPEIDKLVREYLSRY